MFEISWTASRPECNVWVSQYDSLSSLVDHILIKSFQVCTIFTFFPFSKFYVIP